MTQVKPNLHAIQSSLDQRIVLTEIAQTTEDSSLNLQMGLSVKHGQIKYLQLMITNRRNILMVDWIRTTVEIPINLKLCGVILKTLLQDGIGVILFIQILRRTLQKRDVLLGQVR